MEVQELEAEVAVHIPVTEHSKPQIPVLPVLPVELAMAPVPALPVARAAA